MNGSVFDADFSVALFVNPQQPPEGLLWSYVASPGSVAGVSRVEVSLHSNGSLVTTVWDSGSPPPASPCGQLTAPGVFADDSGNGGLLTTVVILRKAAAQLEVRVDESAWTAADSCSRSAGGSGAGGLLSVAGRAEGFAGPVSAGFRGSVVCVAIFPQHLQALNDSELLTQCNDYGNAASNQSKSSTVLWGGWSWEGGLGMWGGEGRYVWEAWVWCLCGEGVWMCGRG